MVKKNYNIKVKDKEFFEFCVNAVSLTECTIWDYIELTKEDNSKWRIGKSKLNDILKILNLNMVEFLYLTNFKSLTFGKEE